MPFNLMHFKLMPFEQMLFENDQPVHFLYSRLLRHYKAKL